MVILVFISMISIRTYIYGCIFWDNVIALYACSLLCNCSLGYYGFLLLLFIITIIVNYSH